MANRTEIVVVVGATGQQGGAAAQALLERGWRVRAIVRDAASPAARALEARGIELALGDLNDRASLDRALASAYGVFSVQPSAGQPHYGVSPADEVRQGKSLADAAKAAGIEHFVYTSVDGVEFAAGVPHLESKGVIEDHIRAIGLRATVLRPAGFMENFALPGLGLAGGKVTFFGGPSDPVPLIAVTDIGIFAAIAFGDPATYVGKTLCLASDFRTGTEIAAGISRVLNRSIPYEQFPAELLRQGPLESVVAFIERYRTTVDVAALREIHPALLTFDAWLAKEGKAKLEKAFAVQ